MEYCLEDLHELNVFNISNILTYKRFEFKETDKNNKFYLCIAKISGLG